MGRYQATEVTLLVMALAPSAAYKLTDRLTIGVAPQFYYADLPIDRQLRFAVGALYHHSDVLEIGGYEFRARLDAPTLDPRPPG